MTCGRACGRPRRLRRARHARECHAAGGQGALEAARLKHELLTFNDADHAFFNDTGARFNPHAAAEAWRRTLNWFDAAHRHHGNDHHD